MGLCIETEAGCQPDRQIRTTNSNHNKHVKRNEDEEALIKIIDYSKDIGLSMHPNNSIEPLTNNIEKDLKSLKNLYPSRYKPLIEREFIKTVFNNENDEILDENNSFIVMQFNILADMLSGAYHPAGMEDKKTFIGIDKECLEWRYRGLRIIEEILRCNPDILCLQECDRIQFFDEYLGKLGYKYYFAEKMDSPTTKRVGPGLAKVRNKALKSANIEKNDNFNYCNDGCAIFYNSYKFELIGNEMIITSDMNDNNVELTAAGIRLKQKSNEKEFIVVTTHLRSKKSKSGEIQRKNQIETLFTDKIDNKDNLPILFCADMNALPYNGGDYEPECYEYLTNELGFVSLYKEGYTSIDDMKNGNKRGDRGVEPQCTTFKKRIDGTVKHTIDYVFEKSNNDGDGNDNDNGIWNVMEYYSIPDTKNVIPDWCYPSDHFSLCLKLNWKV